MRLQHEHQMLWGTMTEAFEATALEAIATQQCAEGPAIKADEKHGSVKAEGLDPQSRKGLGIESSSSRVMILLGVLVET